MRNVIVNNPENIPDEIVQKAIEMMEQEERRRVIEISIRTTGNRDEYGITPVFEPVPFDRIRRITGYLVGTTDRWNSAKLAELHDREKHDAK